MYQQLPQRFKFKAKKKLGQHFLIDENVLEGILSAAELNPDDVVVEVGPGLGVLTSELAKQAGKVIAIELDSRLVNILRKRLSSFPNVKIIHGDILKFDPRQLLKDDLAAFHCEP